MVKIKVICGGCGIVYKDAAGNSRHALKTPESGPFECDDAQAERLVGLGVAEYVGKVGQPAAKQEGTGEQTEGTGEPKKHLDAAQLAELTIDKLKALAADMGVNVSKCKKKDEYIAAIVAVEVEIDDVDDPDNDLPDLTAADPE